MNDIKYIQLEPAAFLTDIDFQMMDAEQRGVYCSIIFYLYCNNGNIDIASEKNITLLHGKTSILAQISGCLKIGAEWDALWNKIADKFQITGNILTHKRVTAELGRAEEYRKTKSDAGKKGMAARWAGNKDITKVSKVKVSKVKEKKKTYCEFVKLTEEEHKKLQVSFGSTLPDRIQALNDYIGSTGKQYKSHYHTILTWARRNGDEKPKDSSTVQAKTYPPGQSPRELAMKGAG